MFCSPISFTVLVLFFLAPSFSIAKPNCSTLNDRWISHYHSDMNITWEKKELNCQEIDSKDYKLALTFYYLETIQFDEATTNYYDLVSGLPNFYYFGNITDKSSDPRFEGLDLSAHKTNAITTVPFSDGTFEVYLHDNFFALPLIDRLGLLIHESEHPREDWVAHVICSTGPYKGQLACDPSLSLSAKNPGGYERAFWFYAHLTRTSHGHDLDIKKARKQMLTLMNTRFNWVDPEVRRIYGDSPSID